MSFVFNVAKGKIGVWGALPAPNDALIWVPLQTANLEADSVLMDYQSLGALLGGASKEQTTMGRKVVASGGASNVDYGNDWLDVTAPDVQWTNAGGPAISALILCYDPDTTVAPGTGPAASDSTIIPMIKFDYVTTPNGGNITASVPNPGYFRAV